VSSVVATIKALCGDNRVINPTPPKGEASTQYASTALLSNILVAEDEGRY